MKTIKILLLLSLFITLLLSLCYFGYCCLYNQKELHTWQMPMLFALFLDMILTYLQ
jgi:hypothetical protein